MRGKKETTQKRQSPRFQANMPQNEDSVEDDSGEVRFSGGGIPANGKRPYQIASMIPSSRPPLSCSPLMFLLLLFIPDAMLMHVPGKDPKQKMTCTILNDSDTESLEL